MQLSSTCNYFMLRLAATKRSFHKMSKLWNPNLMIVGYHWFVIIYLLRLYPQCMAHQDHTSRYCEWNFNPRQALGIEHVTLLYMLKFWNDFTKPSYHEYPIHPVVVVFQQLKKLCFSSSFMWYIEYSQPCLTWNVKRNVKSNVKRKRQMLSACVITLTMSWHPKHFTNSS